MPPTICACTLLAPSYPAGGGGDLRSVFSISDHASLNGVICIGMDNGIARIHDFPNRIHLFEHWVGRIRIVIESGMGMTR